MFDTLSMRSIGSFLKKFPQFSSLTITPWLLSDGYVFSKLLCSIESESYEFKELSKAPQGEYNPTHLRTFKLDNLSKLVSEMEEFLEQKNLFLNFEEVQLVEAATGREPFINRLFEMVLATLMYSQNKQPYIEKIMLLEGPQQQHFAERIQHSMVCIEAQETKRVRVMNRIKALEHQNEKLKEEIEGLLESNKELEDRMANFEESVSQMESTISEKAREANSEELNDAYLLNQQQAELIDNLKQKLLEATRQHETELIELTMQTNSLREQAEEAETMEQMVVFYKNKYEDTVSQLNKINIWDKERIKYTTVLEEKEFFIAKLHQKIDQLTRNNLELQNSIFDKDMNAEKMQIRIKEMQKDVKNRICFEGTGNNEVTNMRKTMVMPMMNKELEKQNQARTEQLMKLNDAYEKKNKELQNENSKLKKKVDASKVFQLEKKKLETVILQMNARKSQEMDIMVAALYQSNKEYSLKFKKFLIK